MRFIYFNLTVAVIVFVLFELSSYEYAHKFKAMYPDLTYPKTTFAGKCAGTITNAVGSLIPIVNLMLLLVLVFESSTLEDRCMQKMYEKCMKYKEKKDD